MSYELYFHPLALKEWKKLNKAVQTQFKKALARRLDSPHVASASLKGELKNCYKIKLRDAGYRLVYKVEDRQLKVLVLSVGKRDKNSVYTKAGLRN